MHIELAIFSAVPVEVGGQIQPKCTDALILPQANKNKGLSSVNYHLQVRMGFCANISGTHHPLESGNALIEVPIEYEKSSSSP